MSADVVDRSEREVLSLLAKQRDLCRRLNSFAQCQRSLITGNDSEQLLALMGERQQLLDELTRTNQLLKPLQQNWAQVRGLLSAAQAIEADEMVGEVNRLLAGILRMDEADTQLLSARKKMTAHTLQQVGQGRQANVAYAATVNAGTGTARVDWTDE